MLGVEGNRLPAQHGFGVPSHSVRGKRLSRLAAKIGGQPNVARARSRSRNSWRHARGATLKPIG